ncbi:RimJ/RimL family protein N-acetyltransferase [Silvibacterium bohemicum]|uniref:RimJ/RimL family protein N-acetyltransferase n=1 Tax=Silvibacterium bohemicum TaxID=1577686 RepID=A0A841K1W1_9BACT|nr:GNAT family protein [Silvibacterium bohemicum]MBB6144224.1 RimJ/RimL family protein N-acetyltransferase [Silvibacterium bohemicum]
MAVTPITLEGQHVVLEPMRMEHLDELAAVGLEPSIWKWMPMRVESRADLQRWMEQALKQAAQGWALPFVTRAVADKRVVGSTRYMDIDARNRGLEIGGTWLAPAWRRTGINVEAKYLLMQHAFEELGAIRVALKTHHENLQSQTAIAALGAKQEGIFRNHMIMPDGSFRHSVWFSVTAEEWPGVKARLRERMARYS